MDRYGIVRVETILGGTGALALVNDGAYHHLFTVVTAENSGKPLFSRVDDIYDELFKATDFRKVSERDDVFCLFDNWKFYIVSLHKGKSTGRYSFLVECSLKKDGRRYTENKLPVMRGYGTDKPWLQVMESTVWSDRTKFETFRSDDLEVESLLRYSSAIEIQGKVKEMFLSEGEEPGICVLYEDGDFVDHRGNTTKVGETRPVKGKSTQCSSGFDVEETPHWDEDEDEDERTYWYEGDFVRIEGGVHRVAFGVGHLLAAETIPETYKILVDGDQDIEVSGPYLVSLLMKSAFVSSMREINPTGTLDLRGSTARIADLGRHLRDLLFSQSFGDDILSGDTPCTDPKEIEGRIDQAMRAQHEVAAYLDMCGVFTRKVVLNFLSGYLDSLACQNVQHPSCCLPSEGATSL
jgi:hypothetical protein